MNTNIGNLSNIMFIFVDKHKKNIEGLQKYFGDLYNVNLIQGNIVQVPKADCLVCPGNSYGHMDSGVEKTINIIIDGAKERVKNVINAVYHGEQPVGTSIILDTYDPKYKYLAHVPTCRAPSDVSETHNAYTAFRALLSSILNHNRVNPNKISSVICTGFCTGVGKMCPKESARQMRIAYNCIDGSMQCNKETSRLITKLLE